MPPRRSKRKRAVTPDPAKGEPTETRTRQTRRKALKNIITKTENESANNDLQTDSSETPNKNPEKSYAEFTEPILKPLRCDDVIDSLCSSIRKRQPLVIKGYHMNPLRNNVVHQMYGTALGQGWKPTADHYSPVASMVSQMELFRTASPFDRRCTVVEWHPTQPHLMVVGSKGGDLILWNTLNVNHDKYIEGRGPGGNISAVKFHPDDPSRIYTSALDGKVGLQDFTGRCSEIYLDTMNWEYWYCSLDINPKRNLIATGDNSGWVTLLSSDGKTKMLKERLHKNKVTHCEFSPREDWLLCTASTDRMLKIWDTRMIKNRQSAIACLQHNKPINSAYFNSLDGTRLLTTDQHQEIRIYRAPEFYLERTIDHPHRFFQHITPIKAAWHPLEDLIVVGRYPEAQSTDQRTIDIYCADSGSLVCQMKHPSAKGIVSLNKFNSQGDKLASTMSVNILLWSRQEKLMEEQEKLLKEMRKSLGELGSGLGGSGRSGRNGSSNDGGRDRRKRGGNDHGKGKMTDGKKSKTDLKMKMTKKK